MVDYKSELSWKTAFRTYGFGQMCKDSKVPTVLSVIFVLLACVQDKWTLAILIEKLSSTIINIIPDFISILIASFAIWISFFLSKTIEFIKKNVKGEELLNELNASFLIEIAFSIIGMILTLCVILCCWFDFDLPECYAKVIDFFVLWILLFISFAILWWLIYIAKNLHNIAKFTILYESIKSKDSKKEDTK